MRSFHYKYTAFILIHQFVLFCHEEFIGWTCSIPIDLELWGPKHSGER